MNILIQFDSCQPLTKALSIMIKDDQIIQQQVVISNNFFLKFSVYSKTEWQFLHSNNHEHL